MGKDALSRVAALGAVRTDPGVQPYAAKQLVDQTHSSSPTGD